MGETSGYLVDPKSARAVLEVLADHLDFSIDYGAWRTAPRRWRRSSVRSRDAGRAGGAGRRPALHQVISDPSVLTVLRRFRHR